MNNLHQLGIQLACALLLSTSVSAQTVSMEANGKVIANTMTSGPLAGAPVFAPVQMTFDVNVPGQALAPGQYENYTIVSSTFQLDAGGFQLPMAAQGVKIALQNNFPGNDGVHLINKKIGSGIWLEFELWAANGSVFSSTDATQEAGTYYSPAFQATSWLLQGAGGYLEIEFTNFIIHPTATPGQLTPFDCGVNPPQSLVSMGGLPKVGQVFTLGVDNPTGAQAPGSFPILFFSSAPDASSNCGSVIAGFGMAGGGAPGALLIDLLAPNPMVTIYGAAWTGPGQPVPIPIAVPNLPILVGATFYAQAVLVDPVTPAATFGVTNRMNIVIGG